MSKAEVVTGTGLRVPGVLLGMVVVLVVVVVVVAVVVVAGGVVSGRCMARRRSITLGS